MKLISNWQKMWKSLAVILPFITTVVYAVITYYIDANLIPVGFLPVAIVISGYLGRIIKQPKL